MRHRKTISSIFVLSPIFMLLILACGTGNPAATETPTPLGLTATKAPTVTTYPTYTPMPSPTRMPTRTPYPTRTSMYQPKPTETENVKVSNCKPAAEPDYLMCLDNTANIQVEVPADWTDINGGPWTYDGKDIGVAISVAPNLEKFHESLNAEGLFFGASPTYAQYVGSTELLDIYTTAYRESCQLAGRYSYDDTIYVGKYDKYVNCGGKDGYDAYILAAKDKVDPLSKLILLEMQVPPGDVSIRNKIWSTFLLYF